MSPVLFGATYLNLSEKDKVEWDNRILSTIHALGLVLAGSYVYHTDERYYADWHFTHGSLPAAITFAYSAGYFVVDTYFVVKVCQ